MPWRETDVLSERVEFVTLARESEESFSALCRSFGVSRTTGYRWLGRYVQQDTFTALVDRSRAPKHNPGKTEAAVEARVVALRQEYGWGAKKLQVLLEREEVRMGLTTLNRILKRNGLLRREDAHRPAPHRFERAAPNELWQMDFKGRFHVQEGPCYPLSVLDDHSRFLLGLHPLQSIEDHATYEALVSTFREYGVPQAMLMDHGIPWWNTNSPDGLSWFAVQLMNQGITLYFSGFRHPQTQGKVEAFHRTLGRAHDHFGFPLTLAQAGEFYATLRFTYKQVRPHEGIGMQVPAERYRSSPSPYNPTPPPYHYPQELQIGRLNSQGSLTYCGRRYFVAKSLADQRVGFREIDSKLLVCYRHMYVREIDLRTGETHAFFRPVRGDTYV